MCAKAVSPPLFLAKSHRAAFTSTSEISGQMLLKTAPPDNQLTIGLFLEDLWPASCFCTRTSWLINRRHDTSSSHTMWQDVIYRSRNSWMLFYWNTFTVMTPSHMWDHPHSRLHIELLSSEVLRLTRCSLTHMWWHVNLWKKVSVRVLSWSLIILRGRAVRQCGELHTNTKVASDV